MNYLTKVLKLRQQWRRSIYTSAQVRELDRIVIEKFGISGYELMQRAGCFSYETLKKTYPGEHRINVICGSGNNAGDGYVLAKLAIEDQDENMVSIYNCFSPEKLKGDAKRAHQDLLTLEPDFFDIYSNDGMSKILALDKDIGIKGVYSDCVVVDAIFGTGLTRDIDNENLVSIIKMINDRLSSEHAAFHCCM